MSATVSTGTAIDVSSLTKGSYTVSLSEAVTDKVQPYLDQADAVTTEMNTNSSFVTAYQSMQTLLLSLQSATANLSTEAVMGSNTFNARTASLSSTGTAASSLLSVSVQSGTTTGSHTVVVDQLASSEVDTSATQTVSSTTALGYTGSFVLSESGMTAQTISVTSSMSVTDIVASINGYSSYSGVSASVVSVDSSHSVLVLAGADTNKPLTMTDVSGGILGKMGVIGQTVTSSVTSTSTSTALNTTGSFTVNGGTNGSGGSVPFSVSVTSTMSLDDVVSAINSASSSAGSDVTAADTNGVLTMTTANGTQLSLSNITGNAATDLGIPISGAANQAYGAHPSKVTIDGVEVQRDSNSISDVISGITLNLNAVSTTSTVTLQVQPDTGKVSSAISSFVTAYNTWESYVTANEATNSDGTASSSAVLFGNETLRDASLQIDSTLTGLFRNNSLGGLGISLDGNNNLQIDSNTLSSQLSSNFTGAMYVFNAVATTSDSSLQPYGSNYSTYTGSFPMAVTTDASGNVTGVSVNGDSSLFTFSNNVITGASGSAYSGMSFKYSGTGGTVTVTSSQGIAAQMYQVSNTFGNGTSGSVQSLISSLQSQNTLLQTQYNNDVTAANNYASYLLSWYSSIESQINSYGETSSVLKDLMSQGTSG
jgi:flagellar hook-associated protein 2